MENMSHVIQVIQGGIGAVLSVYGVCLWLRDRGKGSLRRAVFYQAQFCWDMLSVRSYNIRRRTISNSAGGSTK